MITMKSLEDLEDLMTVRDQMRLEGYPEGQIAALDARIRQVRADMIRSLELAAANRKSRGAPGSAR